MAVEEKHYVGTTGTDIIVNIGENINTATNTKFKVKKPDNGLVEWDAVIYNNNYLKYTVQENDWSIPGVYKLHSHLTIDNWTGDGELATFTIYKLYGYPI